MSGGGTIGRQAHWDRVYGATAEDAVSWFQADASARVALVERWMPERGAAIVDVGSGLSRLIPALVAAGYRDVTALDVSAEAVARACARTGVAGVQWVVADVTAWRPACRYGLWHDRAVLHFLIDEAGRAGYRRALDEGTGPGSVVILSTFASDGPERCSGVPVRRHGAADLEVFLREGFVTLEAFRSVHVTPGGAEQRFQTLVARRG